MTLPASRSLATHSVADCVFTLEFPVALEEAVLDVLLAHPQWVSGVTVLHVQGVGVQASLVSAMERVQGRARRVMVQALMQHSEVPLLIQVLKQEMRSPEVIYWATPLLGSGSLI